MLRCSRNPHHLVFYLCMGVSLKFFSGTLQLHGKFCYCHKMLSVVCRLWCECIVTKWLKLGSCSFHYNISSALTLPAKFDYKIWRGHFDRGLQLGCGGFCSNSISWKRCKIELRWQLITNRNSYVGFRLQQKLMTLNDLERQFMLCHPCCAYCD